MTDKNHILILIMLALIFLFPLAVKADGESASQVLVTTDQQDCENACAKRGYASASCYAVIEGSGSSCPSYADSNPDVGKCANGFWGLAQVNCACCHSCSSTPPSAAKKVGACTLTITPIAWDNTDGSIFGYNAFTKDTDGKDTDFIQVSMDDNKEHFLWFDAADCGKNLELKNSWWDSGAGKINIKTEILQRDASNDLGGGYALSISSGCKYSSSLVSNSYGPKDSDGHTTTVTGTSLSCESAARNIGINKGADTSDYLETEIAVTQCGDGICSSSCGEDKSTCPADCKECTSDNDCAGKADCADSRYWLDPKQCSANTCATNYKYCDNGQNSAANCATQACGTSTYYCTKDASSWAWRLTKPNEVCGNDIDNDCDGLADNNDPDCCNSADYTSCSSKYALAGAKTGMCGADQYYYASVSSPALIAWALTPTANADYDLYVKKDSCATTSSWDYRPYKNTGEAESVNVCMPSGTSNALIHKASGTGAYGISLSKTDVECCNNDRDDGTSSQCPIQNNKHGTCRLPPLYSTNLYTCEYPACISNSQCADNYCCDASRDSSGGLPSNLRGSGNCVLKGDIKQPYLCTS